MTLKSVLLEADELINGDREQDYGHPSENLQRIADLWEAHLSGRKLGVTGRLTAQDVAWMMMQVKQARAMQGNKRDTIVDAAGYIGLIERIGDV